MIQVENLEKKFGTLKALDDVSFSVSAGEIVGILGPNGSGKTTLINCILANLKPDRGKISVQQQAIVSQSDVADKVGVVMEVPRLYPNLSAKGNLQVFGKLVGADAQKQAQLLALVGLENAGDKKFSMFSLGMKQRLAIAVSLLADPGVLIFDEPTNGLDPEGIGEIRELILKLTKTGKTVLFCSHLIAEVQQICNRIIILQNGKLIGDEMLSNIQSPEWLVGCADKAKLVKALGEIGAARVRIIEADYSTSHTGGIPAALVELKEKYDSASLNADLQSRGVAVALLQRRSNLLEQYFLAQVGGNKIA